MRRGRILFWFGVLTACSSAPPTATVRALRQKMEHYVFDVPLPQLRKNIIQAVWAEQAARAKRPRAAEPVASPLQEYPFLFEGRLREPTGSPIGNTFTVTEADWESHPAKTPYDIVENSEKRFVFVHANLVYVGTSFEADRSELKIFELQKFRKKTDRTRMSSGVVDLDASLHDATRDLAREWSILERIDPEKATRFVDQARSTVRE